MMRNVAATVALLATVFSGSAVLPAAAQDDTLEGLIEDAQEGVVSEEDYSEMPEADWFLEEELDDLVAPVALYPDALLAQVLVASTFPLQIVKADRILDASADMSDDELTEAVEAQDWDPSVLVLLSAFPTVVQRMADDLEDTERLGIAMAQQDEDVLAAVQRMRERAEETGWLESNAAHVVEHQDDQIYIEPADPDVIYVPRYDPTLAYTSAPTAQPVIVPPGSGRSMLSNPLVAGAIGFGAALLVNQVFGDDDDEDEEGWDDYWDRPRAIDWRDREVYHRPYHVWIDREHRREIAWSQERDRYWDRQANRWRREAQQARRQAWRERREARAWEVRRDPETGAARVLPRDWRDAVAGPTAEERREAAEERRRREAAEERQRTEAQRERRREAAEERRRRDAAEERQQTEAQRAAEERRREAAEERRQTEARQQAAEEHRKREAAEDRQQTGAQRAAEERKRKAAEDRQQTEAQRAAEERRREAAEERRQTEAEAQRAAEERRKREAAEQRQREQQAAEERRKREAAEQRQRQEAARQRQEAEARQAEERRRQAAVEQRRRQEAAQRQQIEARQAAEEQQRRRQAAEQRQRSEAEQREPQRQPERRNCRNADTPQERRACQRGG